MTSVDWPVNRDYVRYLRAKLVEAEAGLLEMSQNYGDAKARFDQMCARRGIDPGADMVSYQEVKALHPELGYWYSKVEHFQREMTAYGTALTGIEAAQRMLASDDDRRSQPDDGHDPRRAGDASSREASASSVATGP